MEITSNSETAGATQGLYRYQQIDDTLAGIQPGQLSCPGGNKKFNLASQLEKAQARLGDACSAECSARKQILQEQISQWVVQRRQSIQRHFADGQVVPALFCISSHQVFCLQMTDYVNDHPVTILLFILHIAQVLEALYGVMCCL